MLAAYIAAGRLQDHVCFETCQDKGSIETMSCSVYQNVVEIKGILILPDGN